MYNNEGGYGKTESVFYIWKIEDLLNGDHVREAISNYDEFFGHNEEIFKMPEESLKLDSSSRNVLLFDQNLTTDRNEFLDRLMVFYDDNSLEFYQKNVKNEYLIYFRYKLEFDNLTSFTYYDSHDLYFYEKVSSDFQLLKFNCKSSILHLVLNKFKLINVYLLLVMDFDGVYKTGPNNGKNLLCGRYGDVLFYDKSKLKHCYLERQDLSFYHFVTKDKIQMSSSSKNAPVAMCKILNSK